MNRATYRRIILLLIVYGFAFIWFSVLFSGKPRQLASLQAMHERPFTGVEEHLLPLNRFARELFFRAQSDLTQGKVYFRLLDEQGLQLAQWINSENQTTVFNIYRDFPAGTYRIEARGDNTLGHYNIVITIPPRFTRWQAFLLLMGILIALMGSQYLYQSIRLRGQPKPPQYFLNQFIFIGTVFLLCTLCFYLILHEGGHALIGLWSGTLDWSRTDIFGLWSDPHVGNKGNSVEVAGWILSLRSIAGPLLPSLFGYAMFLFWRSSTGQEFRRKNNTFDLLYSVLLLSTLYPHFGVFVPMTGLGHDGDYQGFIAHAPAAKWMCDLFLIGMAVVNAYLLYTVGKHTLAALKTKLIRCRIIKAPPTLPVTNSEIS